MAVGRVFLWPVTALFLSPGCDAVGDGQRASRREACAYPDFMTGDSLFVKTCHYTRIGCDEISLAGFPSTAVRFSSRLAIPYSHDLTD